MKVNIIRSDKVYQKLLAAENDKKDDIYRYELMEKFAYKWACYNIPIKAKQKGGYDVIMAGKMLGYLYPTEIVDDKREEITEISKDSLWSICEKSISDALLKFIDNGIALKVEEYNFTILLPDPNSVYTKLSEGCCGDGGIPGSIFLSLIPTKQNIEKIPPVLAHECNHNVRFQFIKWSNDITLEEMMINEGLAENYATWLYGEEKLGPWVRNVDEDTLQTYIKPIIKGGLHVQGLEGITAYLYGDEIAIQRGYFPEGLPFCAGYACGYYMIKYFLQKTGISIVDATILPYAEISAQIKEFWDIE